jgi:hypothetical protein
VKRLASLIVVASAVATGSVAVLTAGSASAASTSLPTLTIALDGTSVTVGGQAVSGAVNIQTTVTKEKMGEPFLARLNPGVTVAQAFAAVQSHHGDLNALDGLATIVFDQDASSGVTTVGQTVLQPGNYAALDVVNTGNGNAPPFTTFTVTQSASPAALPAANATETAIEFAFRGPTVLHDSWVVRGVNDGYLVHMDDAAGVKSKAVGKRVIALLLAGKDRQAMKLTNSNSFSLQEPLSSGQQQQAVLNTPPGWYVEACFMNTQDGREHTQLGMERLIKVVK